MFSTFRFTLLFNCWWRLWTKMGINSGNLISYSVKLLFCGTNNLWTEQEWGDRTTENKLSLPPSLSSRFSARQLKKYAKKGFCFAAINNTRSVTTPIHQSSFFFFFFCLLFLCLLFLRFKPKIYPTFTIWSKALGMSYHYIQFNVLFFWFST